MPESGRELLPAGWGCVQESGGDSQPPFDQAFSARNAFAPPDLFPLLQQAGQGEGKPDVGNTYTMPITSALQNRV